MPIVTVTLDATIDGVSIFGRSPLVRRVEMTTLDTFDYKKIDDGDGTSFTSLPIGNLAALQALLVRTDEPVTLRLNAQQDVVLASGGLLLVLDAAFVNAPLASVNANGNDARLKGFGAGS